MNSAHRKSKGKICQERKRISYIPVKSLRQREVSAFQSRCDPKEEKKIPIHQVNKKKEVIKIWVSLFRKSVYLGS